MAHAAVALPQLAFTDMVASRAVMDANQALNSKISDGEPNMEASMAAYQR